MSCSTCQYVVRIPADLTRGECCKFPPRANLIPGAHGGAVNVTVYPIVVLSHPGCGYYSLETKVESFAAITARRNAEILAKKNAKNAADSGTDRPETPNPHDDGRDRADAASSSEGLSGFLDRHDHADAD